MSLEFVVARRRFVRSLLVAPLAIVLALTTACGSDDSTPTGMPSQPGAETFAASLGISIGSFTKKSDDLYIKDLVVGTGGEAVNGRTLRVHYTGWLPNGTQFETSVGRTPIEFPLGTRAVISGWDQGILGMKVGGKRRLVIGSNLAYGASGQGSIGPNTTLIFDVELVSVQ